MYLDMLYSRVTGVQNVVVLVVLGYVTGYIIIYSRVPGTKSYYFGHTRVCTRVLFTLGYPGI